MTSRTRCCSRSVLRLMCFLSRLHSRLRLWHLQLASRCLIEPQRRRRKAQQRWRSPREDKERSSLDGEMVPLTGVAVRKDGYQVA